jgi:hypothetical protein
MLHYRHYTNQLRPRKLSCTHSTKWAAMPKSEFNCYKKSVNTVTAILLQNLHSNHEIVNL